MDNLLAALHNLASLATVIYISGGVLCGIVIGALPGLTATMGVALLLPFTFGMSAQNGILMLLGIYAGAIYGGSITAILLKTPGTPAAAATVLDGYTMAEKGEPGRALGISTFSSSIGGVISAIMLMCVSPLLAKFALKFGAQEYFALSLFGISIIASISGKSIIKGLIAGVIGLALSCIGLDPITAMPRFTFGSIHLYSGLSFVPVMIGLFALSQVFCMLDDGVKNSKYDVTRIKRVFPRREDIRKILPDVFRSGFIGCFIGAIPGAGTDIGAFVSYNEAKRWSKHPEDFGSGIPEGIAAPEAGNNGVTGGAMIPLLTLGIPGDAVAAVMLGALTIQGLQPGPLLYSRNGPLMYTIFLGFLLANLGILLFGMLGIRLFTKITMVPKQLLMPAITVLCIVGSFALNNSMFDVYVMIGSGIVGYFFQKAEIPTSPIILGLILGSMAESNFRRALLTSGKDFTTFLTRPISLIFIIIAAITLIAPLISRWRKSKQHR